MADDGEKEVLELRKQVAQLKSRLDEVTKKGQVIIKETETLIKQVEGFKAPASLAKGAGLISQAKKLGVDGAVLKAVEDAEKRDTRGACEAALKLVAKDKKLEPLGKLLRSLLDKDDGGAKVLKVVQAKAEAQESLVKGIEADIKALKVPKV